MRILKSAALFLLLSCACACAFAAADSDIFGRWRGVFRASNGREVPVDFFAKKCADATVRVMLVSDFGKLATLEISDAKKFVLKRGAFMSASDAENFFLPACMLLARFDGFFAPELVHAAQGKSGKTEVLLVLDPSVWAEFSRAADGRICAVSSSGGGCSLSLGKLVDF